MPNVNSRKQIIVASVAAAVIAVGMRLAVGPRGRLMVVLITIPIVLAVIVGATIIAVYIKKHLATNPRAVARRTRLKDVVSSGKFLAAAILLTVVFGSGMSALPRADSGPLSVWQIMTVVGFWASFVSAVLSYALYALRRANPAFASIDTSQDLGPLAPQEVQNATELIQVLRLDEDKAKSLTKSTVSGPIQIGEKMPSTRLARGIYTDTDIYYDNSFAVGGHFFTNIPMLDSFTELLDLIKQHDGQMVEIEYVKEINRVLRVTQGAEVLYELRSGRI